MEAEGATAGCSTKALEKSHVYAEEPSLRSCGLDDATLAAGNTSFNCNICLHFAVEPVVTLCGHLYCWPCIYKWLQVNRSTSSHQCPVCKGPLSENDLVPLYGQGAGLASKESQQSLEIPSRPPAYRAMIGSVIEHHPHIANLEDEYVNLRPQLQQHYNHHYNNPYDSYMPSSSPVATSVFQSTAGLLLGGMAVAILPWAFRNHELASGINLSSPNSAIRIGNSARPRRQELRVVESLHQLWIFLFCCALLCLLFF